MTRLTAWIAAGLLAASTGCASWQASRARSQYLTRELDGVTYVKPLGEVWNEVRKLLAEKQYPLAGDDAKAVGQEEGFILTRIVSPSRETRVDSSGTWRLDTSWNHGIRYHADGMKVGSGSRVRFTMIEQDMVENRNERGQRDLQMELELTRRVDPDAAARIEAGLEALDRPAAK